MHDRHHGAPDERQNHHDGRHPTQDDRQRGPAPLSPGPDGQPVDRIRLAALLPGRSGGAALHGHRRWLGHGSARRRQGRHGDGRCLPLVQEAGAEHRPEVVTVGSRRAEVDDRSIAEVGPGPSQQPRHGGGRHLQRLAHQVFLHAGPVHQHQHRPFVMGDAGQRGLFHPRPTVGQTAGTTDTTPLASSGLGQAREIGGAQEPRDRIAVLAGHGPVGPQVGLDQQRVGSVAVEQAGGERRHEGVVPLDQLGEGPVVAALRRGQEPLVVGGRVGIRVDVRARRFGRGHGRHRDRRRG